MSASVVVWTHFADVMQLVVTLPDAFGTAEVLATCVRDRDNRTLWWLYVTEDGSVPGELLRGGPVAYDDARRVIDAHPRVKAWLDLRFDLWQQEHSHDKVVREGVTL